MANKMISELPELNAISGSDYFPVVHEGSTEKVAFSVLAEKFGNSWSEITGKPFNSIGNYLKVSSNNLTLSDSTVTTLNQVGTNTSSISTLNTKVNTNTTDITALKTNTHTHTNKTVIDKFSVNTDNELLWNGQPIEGSGGLDFEALSDALTGGTLTNIAITPNTATETFNIVVSGLKDIGINDDNHWTIEGVDTGKSAVGVDGYSPVANVSTNGAKSTITITDKVGTTVANIISPTVELNRTDLGVQIVVTDMDGTKSATVDGYSPTVAVTPIQSGNQVSITDRNGTKSFNVMNGTDGVDGITTIETTKQYYNISLRANDWSGNIPPYTQSVALDAINAQLNPVVDLIVSDNVNVGYNEEVSWSYVTKMVTGDKLITAYCYVNKPTVDLNLLVEVC